jgi:hypothetical protein
VTERVLIQDEVRLTQDEVRELTGEETDQVSGGETFAQAFGHWYDRRMSEIYGTNYMPTTP